MLHPWCEVGQTFLRLSSIDFSSLWPLLCSTDLARGCAQGCKELSRNLSTLTPNLTNLGLFKINKNTFWRPAILKIPRLVWSHLFGANMTHFGANLDIPPGWACYWDLLGLQNLGSDTPILEPLFASAAPWHLLTRYIFSSSRSFLEGIRTWSSTQEWIFTVVFFILNIKRVQNRTIHNIILFIYWWCRFLNVDFMVHTIHLIINILLETTNFCKNLNLSLS